MIQTRKNQAALIYCRGKPDQLYGTKWQENKCLERCYQQQIPVLKVIKDIDVSWSTFNRKWLQQVLKRLDQQHRFLQSNTQQLIPPTLNGQRWITHLVCTNADRLSRNDLLTQAKLIQQIEQAGVVIIYVNFLSRTSKVSLPVLHLLW